MNRFDNCNENTIKNYIEKSKNINTTKATNQWIHLYRLWAENKQEVQEIETLSPVELDAILQHFYAEVKKKNGDDYEPNSLCSMQAGIDRYLKDKKYKHSIIRDDEFATSRSVLEGKARVLRENGKGKRPNKASSLTHAEEEILWSCGQLGSSTPSSLINTLWWQFTQHFGLRGRQEHHSMQIQDFSFRKDDKRNDFVTFAEGITKTRPSGLHEKHRLVIPKMFATKTSRCPVEYFKLYLSKRPAHLRSSGPLYLTIIQSPSTNSVWYKSMPMGQNKIDTLMKCMVANSPLSNQSSTKKLTNHSARKTLVKKLKSNNVPKSEIIGITGHTNEAGLDAYDSGDKREQQMMSYAIDNVQKATTSSGMSATNNNWLVPVQQSLLHNPTFKLVDYNYFNKSPKKHHHSILTTVRVNFYNAPIPNSSHHSSPPPPKKRRYVVYSSDSSQE